MCKSSRLVFTPAASRQQLYLPMEGLSQDQVFLTSCVPGRTTHGHLPLGASAVDGRYSRSSDRRRRAAFAPSGEERGVCPLTAFIIWVPREGRANKELKNGFLVAASEASDTHLYLN